MIVKFKKCLYYLGTTGILCVNERIVNNYEFTLNCISKYCIKVTKRLTFIVARLSKKLSYSNLTFKQKKPIS